MVNPILAFMKGQDQLGSSININYKGSDSFGTVLGGCLSLFMTLFFTFFIFTQLWSWNFAPSYSQTIG